jgi:hypothetical protein
LPKTGYGVVGIRHITLGVAETLMDEDFSLLGPASKK